MTALLQQLKFQCENFGYRKKEKSELARSFPRFERLVRVTMIIFLIKIEVVISRKKLLVPQRPPGECSHDLEVWLERAKLRCVFKRLIQFQIISLIFE